MTFAESLNTCNSLWPLALIIVGSLACLTTMAVVCVKKFS